MAVMEQISKIPLKKKVLITAAISVVIGSAFWFFYYAPMQEKFGELRTQYDKLKADKQDAIRRKATYDKDRRHRDDLKKAHGVQLRALPSEAEISSFLESLNTQAELVGLEIISVKPRKEEPSQYYARIPVELKLTGTYYQLAKFFYLVGNLDRIINIENITLGIKTFEESNAVLSAGVLATTFRALADSGNSSKKKSNKKKRK